MPTMTTWPRWPGMEVDQSTRTGLWPPGLPKTRAPTDKPHCFTPVVPGTYHVTLKVSDPYGGNDTKVAPLEVADDRLPCILDGILEPRGSRCNRYLAFSTRNWIWS